MTRSKQVKSSVPDTERTALRLKARVKEPESDRDTYRNSVIRVFLLECRPLEVDEIFAGVLKVRPDTKKASVLSAISSMKKDNLLVEVMIKIRRVPKPPTGEFGPALRAIREEKNVPLRELSKQLAVSLPYLSDVERGERDPLSNARIKRVALFLNVDPTPLLVAATKERGRVVLDVPKEDASRIQAAMLLSLWWPIASDEMVTKLQELLKTAS